MNIKDKDNIHECTSCQMCAAVCPKDAISIALNKDGFYRPTIDNEKCVDCGICKGVCYKYADIQEYKDTNMLLNFAASAKSDEVVSNTTSGGLGDVFCEQLLKEGYLCVGVTYDTKNNIAISKIAETREDSISFRGSKYIQSYTFEAFKKIVDTHLNDKVAVFGTPCHIFAIDKYLKKRNKRENFILIDIYCHGCPSMKVWKKYLEYVNKKTCEKSYDQVNFRSKVFGWGNYYVTQMKKDNKILFTSPKINDRFYTLFFSDVLLNEACYDCKLRSTMHFTDIRIGDFWGKVYLKNTRGVSLVTINPLSDKGKKLFEKVKEKITFKLHDSNECISYQSWGKSYEIKTVLRQNLLTLLEDPNKTIDEALKFYWNSQAWKSKLKRISKNIILLMPQSFVSFSKLLYRK